MKLLSFTFALVLIAFPSNDQTVRLEDRSDWWSFNNEKEPGMHGIKLLEKPFDRGSFKFLGFSLDTVSFEIIAAKLGKAKVVDRGDASYSRSQVCYVSNSDTDSQKVYLIFEGGRAGLRPSICSVADRHGRDGICVFGPLVCRPTLRRPTV